MEHRQVSIGFVVLILWITLTSGSCPKIISRKEWGAEEPKSIKRMREPVLYVALHHTYIPAVCTTTDQCKKAMKHIQNAHKPKWGDIGYSFCIGGDGNIYEGRGWGRVGTHTKGWNSRAIGICAIGDYTTEKPADVMLKAIDELTDCGMSTGHLSKNFKYFAHLQVHSTECPGKAFYEYIKTLPRWVSKP